MKELHQKTAKTLGCAHTHAALMTSLILCLLVTLTAVLCCSFASVLVQLYLPHGTATVLLATALPLLALALAVLFVLPVWLGRLRMAGLCLADGAPPPTACLYYFENGRRYLRAVRISALLALIWGLTLAAIVGLFAGAISLYRSVLLFYLSPFVAFFILVLLLHIALATAAAILYFSGSFLPFAALAVGNEELAVRAALAVSVRVGRKNLKQSFFFTLRMLLFLALSLFSVMVLYLLWFSHYYNLFYLRYAMALSKEASQ